MGENNTGRKVGAMGEKKKAEIAEVRAKGGLFGGVTVSDCVYLFHMDRRTILGKIGDLKPAGHNARGSPLYHIDKIAPYLIPPVTSVEQIEEYMSRMDPRDLPPRLSKEFWNGKRARQAFEENEGDLWRTEKVLDACSGLLKTVRMNLLLLPDMLERRSALTDRQKEDIRGSIDETLKTMREDLVTQFLNEEGQDDRDATRKFDEAEDDFDDVFDDLDQIKPEFDEDL